MAVKLLGRVLKQLSAFSGMKSMKVEQREMELTREGSTKQNYFHSVVIKSKSKLYCRVP